MRTRDPRARRTLRAAALASLLIAVAMPTLSGVASASTTQNNACLGVTGTFSTFAVPITGNASPSTLSLGSSNVTLQNTSVAISVDPALIAAGVNTGLVQAAPALADVGTAGGNGGTLQGQNAVTAAAGTVHLKLSATNTVEGNQTASNASAVSTTFWVVQDPNTLVVTVYTGTPNPPSNSNLVKLTTPLSIAIALADTAWTPQATGTIVFSEAQVTPSTTVAANMTAADKAASPLQLFPKINGTVNVPFRCWAGTANAAGTQYTPGASSTISSATVTPSDGSTTSTTVGGPTTTGPVTTTTNAPVTTTTAAPVTTTTKPQTATTVPGQVLHTGTASYSTDCTNSLQAGSISHLKFVITATAPETVTAGDTFALSKQKWSVTTPGSLLDTGINLGLINIGDVLPGQATPAIKATNTAQGTVVAAPIALHLGPIQENPTTGNAKDLTTTFAVPDMSFASGGGTVSFSMGTTVFVVTIGTLNVKFTCTPTSSTTIISTTVEGHATVTTLGQTPTTVAGTTGTNGSTTGTLPFTGAGRVVALLALALLCIDLGAFALTASSRIRRRRVTRT